VSIVESISVEDLGGMKMKCYNLSLLTSDSTVMVPVSNASRIGLRPLSDPEVVDDIMARLKDDDSAKADDWKNRYRLNLDRMKTGMLDEIVDVLLCLANVATRKALSFRERKMFDHARQLLVFEVAEVQDRPLEDIEEEIDEALGRHMSPEDDNEE